MNNIKSECKKVARSKVAELYRLDTSSPTACKERVAHLKQRLPDYLFIFPEDPQVCLRVSVSCLLHTSHINISQDWEG